MVLGIKEIVSIPDLDPDWVLPSLPRDIRPKCLSDLLKEIPEFQKALLPNSRWAITQINRVLRTKKFIEPCNEIKEKNLYSSVALAVDRGALLLKNNLKNEEVIEFLQRQGDYGKKIATIIEKFEPIAHDLIYRRETSGYLFLLGKLEPIIRGFRPISDLKEYGLPKRFTNESINKWISGIISKSVADEINLLLKTLNKLQLSGEVYPNPIFGGIGPIFGSDGDWISGDTLVELKCTVSGIKRQYVAQIICYSWLGKSGPISSTIPKINDLAICLPRQSSIIVGTIDDWLLAFGAPKFQKVFAAINEYFSSSKHG